MKEKSRYYIIEGVSSSTRHYNPKSVLPNNRASRYIKQNI